MLVQTFALAWSCSSFRLSSDLQVDNMFASCPTERSPSTVPGLHTCMISDTVASPLPESIRTASPQGSLFEYKR
jgi:hypothetical protein